MCDVTAKLCFMIINQNMSVEGMLFWNALSLIIDNSSTWLGHEFSELDIRVLIVEVTDDGCWLCFARAINAIFSMQLH